jgi:hypothetical protein
MVRYGFQLGLSASLLASRIADSPLTQLPPRLGCVCYKAANYLYKNFLMIKLCLEDNTDQIGLCSYNLRHGVTSVVWV